VASFNRKNNLRCGRDVVRFNRPRIDDERPMGTDPYKNTFVLTRVGKQPLKSVYNEIFQRSGQNVVTYFKHFISFYVNFEA
jgi:hypothetical protein